MYFTYVTQTPRWHEPCSNINVVVELFRLQFIVMGEMVTIEMK